MPTTLWTRVPCLWRRLRGLVGVVGGLCAALTGALPAAAQGTAPSAVLEAVAPAPAASAPVVELKRVEITTTRPTDVQERRASTAAKIVIGREEIDRFGDATVGDLLKRLPGVTMQGRPGRGGNIRMRGLGNGYTQILLDGQRVPPGFSLDSLTPEQIERIEILRAPTAETGARAIAGTINIVTREGFTRHINELRLTAGLENGRLQPLVAWTRNESVGPFIVNYSLSAQNVPGVLRDVNRVIGDAGANIHAQLLSTNNDIGYLMIDLDTDATAQVVEGLKKLPTTIQARSLA